MSNSFYVVIPAEVLYDNRLSPSAKLLYGEITALCAARGICWATNEHFAKQYNVSEKSISRWISSLEKCGYVAVECDMSGLRSHRAITILHEDIDNDSSEIIYASDIKRTIQEGAPSDLSPYTQTECHTPQAQLVPDSTPTNHRANNKMPPSQTDPVEKYGIKLAISGTKSSMLHGQKCPVTLDKKVPQNNIINNKINNALTHTRENTSDNSFVIPKLDEIRDFCMERNSPVDPVRFFFYYQSRGWRVGNFMMSDWQAAVCSWESNGIGNNSASSSNHSCYTAQNAANTYSDRRTSSAATSKQSGEIFQDNGRYAVTYDVNAIEAMLDAEWYDDM